MQSSGAENSAHDVAADVLHLANTRDVRRVELLALACELSGVERGAALLWLWEAPWPSHTGQRRPFLALSRYASNVVSEDAPPDLLDQFAYPLIDTESCPDDPACWALGMEHQDGVRRWAASNNFDAHEAIMPVVTVDENREPRAIAFIQLLSSSPIDANAQRNVDIVCGGMALLLTRSRDARKLECIQTLLHAEHAGKSIRDWLKLAADKLMSITNAEAVMMFRETPEGFTALVTRGRSKPTSELLASPQSVVTNVAERRGPVRLRDFDDENERLDAFGTKVHDVRLGELMEAILLDGRVRSVLLSPVVFENHTLAVIALVNKKAETHLARIFSKTDEDVLTNVCGFLKAVLPSIELYEALGEMARIVSPKTLEGGDEAAKVYAVLVKMIPAVISVGLIRRRRRETAYTIERFGGRLWTDDASILVSAPGVLKAAGEKASGHHYITLEVPELPDHYLTVELKRATMTGYERQILLFFAKTLSPILLAKKNEEDVAEEFAQLRHAVRTGVAGVVGYVAEALGCFEIYAKLDYAPAVLDQARFRKSLERANFAAKTSQYLLEESRFLLSNITPESLRGGDHSVSAVVLSVLTTMKPLAEERNVQLNLDNRLRNKGDRAHFDRYLIEMMVFNLIDNGIKYSFRDRPVTVTIDDSRDRWRITVVDYGAQILQRDQEAIFQAFTRRPTGPGSEQRPGTGLGLAVARQVARVHGGDIRVTSESGRGTAAKITFIVSIPKSSRGR
jgi:signal transduction histidine kinase/GAF domain-containing protein